MSEFSDAFAQAFDSAVEVFGDLCTIAGNEYACIIHGFDLNEGVSNDRPRRSQNADGIVILSVTLWEEAKVALLAQGKKTKGAQITIPGGTFRVINDPDAGYTSDTVELQLGPLT